MENIINNFEKLPFSKKIGNNCEISKDVIIGSNYQIGNNVTIYSGTVIGDNVKIYDGAIIGTDPQHINFDSNIDTNVVIGDNVIIREYVTISRSTSKDTPTTIGDGCYLMNYSHVSHDTILGKNVILSNSVQIGGHSFIDDYSNMGGGTLIHQNTNIGKHVMIGAGSLILKNILPFTLLSGRDNQIKTTINKIGIKRNYDENKIQHIKSILDMLKGDKIYDEKIKVLNSIGSTESNEIYNFIINSKRNVLFK